VTLSPLLGDLSDALIPNRVPATEATAAKRTEVVSNPWKSRRAPKTLLFYPAGHRPRARGETAEKSLSFHSLSAPFSKLFCVSKRLENRSRYKRCHCDFDSNINNYLVLGHADKYKLHPINKSAGNRIDFVTPSSPYSLAID
jgi:hypothetical protein